MDTLLLDTCDLLEPSRGWGLLPLVWAGLCAATGSRWRAAADRPAADERASASASGDNDAPDGDAEGEDATVLVVEDNPNLRRYVRNLLEPRYRVIEAEDGRDGLQRARRERPALVVTDVVMPEINGFTMVERLQQGRRTGHIPVVMLTARRQTEEQVEGLERGASAYVTKPFDVDLLLAQIQSLITTRCRLLDRPARSDGRALPSGGATPDPTEWSFKAQVQEVLTRRLSDADLTVEALADDVGCTRRTLTRRVKDAFGQTPSALIRTRRLETGADLLEQQTGTVSEVAGAVGFNSPSYFSRRFKEHFGVSPSTYQGQTA